MSIPSHAVLITDDDGSQWLLATGKYGDLSALYTEAEAESLVRRLCAHSDSGEVGVRRASAIEAYLPGPELDPALEAP